MPSPLPRLSTPEALILCALNWLVPGAGYLAVRDYARGLTFFAVINAILLAGVALGGYVLTPVWHYRHPEFNLVAVLTYLTQALHGSGWLLLHALHGFAAQSPQSFFNIHAMSSRTYSDLGLFHLITAGGLNYYTTVRLYDLTAGNPKLTESAAVQEHQEKLGKASEPAGATEGAKGE